MLHFRYNKSLFSGVKMHIFGVLVFIYAMVGFIKHLNRHWWSYRKRTFSYDGQGKVESILELSLLGNGLKHHFRPDGSVWKKEVYEARNIKAHHFTLYYPSGRVKYKSY